MKYTKKSPVKKFLPSVLCFCILCVCAVMLRQMEVRAAEQTIYVDDDDSPTIQVHPGDTGIILPNYVPDPETDDPEIVYEYSTAWYDSDCILVDASGRYQALGLGEEKVEITGRDSLGNEVFSAAVYFEIQMDMERVKLQKTKLSGYLFPSYTYGDNITYENTEFDVRVVSPVNLSESMPGIDVSCEVSDDEVWVYASLSDNVLHLNVYAQKKCNTKLTVTIAGKEFPITLSLKPVKISASSVLLEKGKTKTLRLAGYSGTVKWSSSNKEFATVSKSGVVRGKKTGNAVITATVGDRQLGCAVSVTTSKLKKVCQRATYIGTNWKYDQQKRALSGYYDCSALVWKAYKQYAGINFGSSGYPGTTVTESKWCREHKCMINSGYTQKKVDKMLLNPGDLVFKSNDPSKPFDTIYHVEMFTGYTCIGYDSQGKPYILPLWAAREAGYSAGEGSLLARPMK